MLTPWTDRAGVVSTEEGHRSGLTPAHVQRADKYGGGYFVNVEGMHHLHCLVRERTMAGRPGLRSLVSLLTLCRQNLVRKSLYYNYEYYKDMGTHAFQNEEHILQLHIST